MARTTVCDLYPEQRYRCQCCDSGCCDRFEILLTEAEAKGIEALRIAGAPPATECFRPGGDHAELILSKGADGHCVFAAGTLCRIHKLHGFAAKPLSCRIFPLHIQHWADGRISAEYRFICPAVGAADGRRLGDSVDQIRSFANQLGMRRLRNDCVYSSRNPAPLTAVRAVHRGFRQLLHEEELPLRLRLFAVALILDFHSRRSLHDAIRRATASFAPELMEFVRKAEPELRAKLHEGRGDALVTARFKSLLCGYLRDDVAVGGLGRLGRAFRQQAVYFGWQPMQRLNAAAPAVTMAQTGEYQTQCRCSVPALELFGQFFFGKLDAMHFCGDAYHRYTYEQGLRHLLLSAPAAFFFAAGYAAEAQRPEISREDMHRAVRLLDMTFGRSPFFRLAAAKSWIGYLSRPGNYAAVLNQMPVIEGQSEI